MTLDEDQYLRDCDRFTDSLIYALTSMSCTKTTDKLRQMALSKVMQKIGAAMSEPISESPRAAKRQIDQG